MRTLMRPRRSWGPVDKVVAALLSLLVLAGGTALTISLLPEGPDEPPPCGEDLQQIGAADECIGVTDEAFVFDEELETLIRDVAAENKRVRQEWKNPEGGARRVPYFKIALMMPFTEDATSAMTMDLIEHALAGAHLAQLRANEDPGPQFQLLLANDGKDLNHWQPVVEQLSGMTDDASPLVAVVGYPSSTQETQHAADALSEQSIPSIGPVIFSTDMSSDYLFKNSASNEHLVLALDRYLEKHPGSGRGYLVWDSREQDNYAGNLREQFERRFREAYGLRQRNSSFVGTTGDDQALPNRFDRIAQEICLTDSDTVFFAGRDRDLPGLISQLADTASCADDDAGTIRIMKVGVGLHRALTTAKPTEDLREAGITLVNAADVHPRWWKQDGARRPSGFGGFHEAFEREKQTWDLGPAPLEDGYTIMYHDAFLVAAQASDASYGAVIDQTPDGKQPQMPTNHDVYETIATMNVFGTTDGLGCVDCIRGASGTFGFDALESTDTDKWPVCKPVPIVFYPEPPEDTWDEKDVYRTNQGIFDGACP